MSQFSLPNGCIKISLENVVEILDSQRKPVNNSERKKRIEGKSNNELFPYFGATGEVGKIDDYIFDDELVALGEDGVPFLENQKRKAYIIRGKTWVNNHAHVLKPIPWLTENRYLCYFLNQFDYKDYVNGGTRLKLTQANMRKIPFNMVPLAEQKTISDKLDNLLARVESIKTRLENIPEILKKFRQSVLSAAVSGNLTEEWRRGNTFVTVQGVLGNYVSIDIGHAFKSKDFTATGVKLLRGQNIEPGALKWNDTKFYSEGILNDFSHLVINAGDIILAMDRPIISTGLKLARATENDLPCVLVQRVARFKDYINICPDFLFILLSDPSFANYIQPNQTGSDIPHISGKQILSYNVKIPNIDEQLEIVKRVEDVFNYIENIQKQTNNALLRINNLTQSILAKAFRGELTAQWREANPELISGLNSAEALLEKITAEKLASSTVKKRAKKTSH